MSSVRRVTTVSGTVYLLDWENSLFMRVPSEQANRLHGDGTWEYLSHVAPFDRETGEVVAGPLRVGVAMMVNPYTESWGLSTNVTLIEDDVTVEDE